MGGKLPEAWGCSSAGRALPSQGRGRGFESPHLHHLKIPIRLSGFSYRIDGFFCSRSACWVVLLCREFILCPGMLLNEITDEMPVPSHKSPGNPALKLRLDNPGDFLAVRCNSLIFGCDSISLSHSVQ